MRVTVLHSALAVATIALVTAAPVAAQHPAGSGKAAKIANAMSAAPTSISAKATIMGWPAKEGQKPPVLRQGTNGWVCYPDMPTTKGNDPMCLDESWQAWMQAYMSHQALKLTKPGIGYMIAPGGAWASNTDPYAETAKPDNDWGYDAPHAMLLVTDASTLAGLPTTRASGGPWVMWTGTPYVHVMIPIASTKAAGTKKP